MIIQNWDAAQTRSIYIKPKANMRTNRDICAEIKAYSDSIASVGSKLEYMHHSSSCHTACVHFDGHALIQVKQVGQEGRTKCGRKQMQNNAMMKQPGKRVQHSPSLNKKIDIGWMETSTRPAFFKSVRVI